MILKEKLTSEAGFQYVIDNMELMCSPGRRRMLQQSLMTDPIEMEAEYRRIATVIKLLADENCNRHIAAIRHQLMQTHDLQGSLNSLHHRQTLDEIELFEIKNFAFLCMETVKAATALGIGSLLAIPDLSSVFDLLDPDNTGIPNFYFYDSYHPELAALRQQIKARRTLLDNKAPDDADIGRLQSEIGDLIERQNVVSREVAVQLSEQLTIHADTLQQAFDRMAYTDFLFAKATLAAKWRLCLPEVRVDSLSFQGLWNPRLKHRNEELKRRYQPIDIELRSGVCLVTGANMAGKTVLLKSAGTAQLMAQFGFYVPAERASIIPVDDVVFCIGDEQNEMNGLSSFASEIIKISDTVRRSRHERMLIMIDEPARTTNPVEGKAIVQAVTTLLNGCDSLSLITTHYSQLGTACRRLRVKGFVEAMSDKPLTPDNINEFMDYSLLPSDDDDVPQEALRIATILQCDQELLDTATKQLSES